MAKLFLNQFVGDTHVIANATYKYVRKHIERRDNIIIRRFEYDTNPETSQSAPDSSEKQEEFSMD